jgi:PhoD-like phosphatase, N-terminal domain
MTIFMKLSHGAARRCQPATHALINWQSCACGLVFTRNFKLQIIWTRMTPDTAEEYGVAWQVATDKAFSKKIKSGEFTTTSERDWTVKVCAQTLHRLSIVGTATHMADAGIAFSTDA